jgi:hypothetical protein
MTPTKNQSIPTTRILTHPAAKGVIAGSWQPSISRFDHTDGDYIAHAAPLCINSPVDGQNDHWWMGEV